MIIKAITLIQPWATLVALYEKNFETRSWDTKYRGPLAIHAGMKIDYEACKQPRIKAVLAKHGIENPAELPVGCIVAITNLIDCAPMLDCSEAKHGIKVQGYKLSDQEYDFGYYAPGRRTWILFRTKKLNNPIKIKGKQRLWNFDLEETKFEGQE